MKYKSTLSVLLVAIVCATVALSSFAQTGEVYSLNVVGFQKLTASSQGLSMVSTPFVRGPATLDDVVGNQGFGHKSSIYADNITFWNVASQSYDSYYLKNDGKWYKFDGTPATNTSVTVYKGFWMDNKQKLSNEIIVVSGDVMDNTVVTNPLIVGLSMVSYPFSTEINLNSSGLTNGFGHKSSLYADNVTT